MKPLPIPPAHDVVRLVASPNGDTLSSLRAYYDGGGSFNYVPVRKVARSLISGELTRGAATQACLSKGSPSGRKQNAEVADLVWEWSKKHSFSCYDIKARTYQIRSDLKIPVKLDFYYVHSGQVYLFWLQPRKTYSLNTQQFGILATVIRQLFAVDDFEGANLQILDLSAPDGSGERATELYGFEELPMLSDAELSGYLGEFAAAYDTLSEEGFEPKKRQYKQPGQDQGQLFP